MQYNAQNMLIKSDDTGGTGIFTKVMAPQAGWKDLNMAVLRLNKGGKFPIVTHENEHISVILGGQVNYRTNWGDFMNIGRRPDVFSGMPYAMYLPRHSEIEIEALTDNVEIAACWAPTDEQHEARLITPQDVTIEIRGGGNATRQINSIVPPGFGNQRLVCVEVYTPPGNWSSYPPHKHDAHREAEDGTLIEADLEEIYFYKIDKPGGYAYQRVYNDDRSIDAVMMAENNDIVIVPEGYHPVVSAHGFTTYYLNFLAGSAQSLANVDDPAYAWVKETWTETDPRVPVVTMEMEK